MASVVQWLSHSPCKPGVAGSIPGFSKNFLPVEPSGAPGTTNPQKNNLKKQPSTVLVSPRKKIKTHIAELVTEPFTH